MNLSRKRVWIPVVLAVLVIAAQVVPVNRDNPPVESEVAAPPEVAAALRESCYDCHSNETVWPWYSHVAPVSWLIAHDVHEARGEVNFSTWNRYDSNRQIKKMKEIVEQVNKGKMPPGNYLTQHPAAKLSAQEKALISDWAGAAAGGAVGGAPGGNGSEDEDD